MKQVSPKQLLPELIEAINLKIPVMIWGKPGVAKSDLATLACRMTNNADLDIRVNLLEPVDFRGIPHVVDGMTKWAMPDFLPNEALHGARGVMKLEELPTGLPGTQTCCYQLVQDRKLGDYVMPEDWTIIGMGNSLSDRAATFDMPSPLKNRFAHFELVATIDDWADWAGKNNIDQSIISFLRFRPELLSTFEPDNTAFATPRSWANLSKRLEGSLLPDTMLTMMGGYVGEQAAGEYLAFRRIQADLPDIDQAIANPDRCDVPDDISILYAFTGALVSRAHPKSIDNVMKLINRFPKEYQVFFLRDAINRNVEIAATQAVITWMQDGDNTELLT